MATIDDIINGTFSSLGRDVPLVPATTSVSDMYAGIYGPTRAPTPTYQPGMMGRGLPSTYSPRLPGGENQQRIRLADGRYVEVNAANLPKGKQPVEITVNGGNPALTASAIPIPRMRPSFGPAWNQPTSMDLAAIEAQNRPAATVGPTLDDLLAYAQGLPDKVEAVNPALAAATAAGTPVTNVTGKMQPTGGGGWLDLLFGPSKNGMGGLAGLLGGPGAGGIVGMLGAPSTPRAPRTARAPDTYTPATSVSGNTGYRNERTGVLHTSDKGHQYGSTSSGQRTDYGASPGQKTAGLKPGDRVYDSSTNSWGLK